jgi:hypothetical protein
MRERSRLKAAIAKDQQMPNSYLDAELGSVVLLRPARTAFPASHTRSAAPASRRKLAARDRWAALLHWLFAAGLFLLAAAVIMAPFVFL